MSDLAFSKNQRTVELLARDILVRDVGDRLPISTQYQELLEVGSGTVQKGLRVLESVGAVTLRARGHRGTFIIDRHVGQLWAIAGLGPVTGALPLPNSPEASGLAAGLRQQFDQMRIPLQMIYLHGSSLRLQMVSENRADFAVVSRGAGEREQKHVQNQQWLVTDLGAYSYYSLGSIVVLLRPHLLESGPGSIKKVGIDRDSYDHTQLTLAEFPRSGGYQYTTHEYPSLPAAVAEGKIDAAVWHRTVLEIPLELVGIRARLLEQAEARNVLKSLESAALLARPDWPELRALLGQLDKERIRDTQERVLRHEIAPVY
jgi:hypothetical protein